MISVLITAYKEPHLVGRAIEGFLDQDYKGRYEILVCSSDKPTHEAALKYAKKHKQVKAYEDVRKGKPHSLNILFKKAKGEIFVMSDADVYVSRNAISELLKQFSDPRTGAVSGRPVSVSPKSNMLGYWSHLLTDVGAHKTRLSRVKDRKFIVVSGYLYAMRNMIGKIPEDALSDDAVIATMIWMKGYKIGYAPEAKVYVKYPTTFDDWILQKRRSTGGYVQIDHYFQNPPRMRTFFREALYGSVMAWLYPKTIKEMFYTLMLFPARLYLWYKIKTEVKKDQTKTFLQIWQPIESTK